MTLKLKRHLVALCTLLTAPAQAAELHFDFTEFAPGEVPSSFQSVLGGGGAEGQWEVVLDDTPTEFEPLTSRGSKTAKRRVLAQLSTDPTDERFPMFVYQNEEFGDFTISARVKNVSGKREQMAGIVFRYQDPQNYYYVRASSLGNTFRFFKVVNGLRSPAIGPEIVIPSGEWVELSVECKGNNIRCMLNGKEAIPQLTDNSFISGKIGFWTKSDSVAYFADTTIVYKPLRTVAERVVAEMVQKYPRLVDLKLFTFSEGQTAPIVAGAKDPADIGQSGGGIEADVIQKSNVYFGKDAKRKTSTVTLPLRDRNGDSVAAVRVIMESFPGQTEKNAIGRALPIVKELEQSTMPYRSLLD